MRRTLFFLIRVFFVLTSSNFLVIKEKALNIAFVEPETVTIRSGHDPSDMLILAPDWKFKRKIKKLLKGLIYQTIKVLLNLLA